MPLIIGLTGGIGCGKSTAAKTFSGLGITVIDTDEISHALTQAGMPALEQIRQVFGQEMFLQNGQLDRSKLRQLVFSDGVPKTRLEAILHPLIRLEAVNRLNQATTPYAILAVPLLLESAGYTELVDKILVVDCSEQQQIERTMARSKLTEKEVRAIMRNQLTRQQRLQQADDILDNSQGEAELRQKIEALHRKFLALAKTAKPRQ